jgi:hypothetical protein
MSAPVSRDEKRLVAATLGAFAVHLSLAALAAKGYFSLGSMPQLLRDAAFLARFLDAMHRSAGFVVFLLLAHPAVQLALWWTARRRGAAVRRGLELLPLLLAVLGLAALFWLASAYAATHPI